MAERVYTESEVKNLLEMAIRLSGQNMLDKMYKGADCLHVSRDKWIERQYGWIVPNIFRYIDDYLKWDDEYLKEFYSRYNEFPMNEYHSIPYLPQALHMREELPSHVFSILTFDEFKDYRELIKVRKRAMLSQLIKEDLNNEEHSD